MDQESSVFRHRVGVRFRDCDAMGHVNNAVFLTYFEECRLACWRQLSGAPMPGASVIVARVECDYRAPAYFGDLLDVFLSVGEIGRSSFTLTYRLVNATSGLRLAEATTVVVTYDYGAGRSIPIPPQTRALLDRFRASS